MPTDTRGPSLAIVTCLKNEGEDLVEWLAFHRAIGIHRFVVYDNESTDATARILDAVPFRDEIVVRRIADPSPQKAAFADAIERFRGTIDWAAFIDGDELIVPLGDRALGDLLAGLEAEDVDGLGLHWRVFGSSGLETRPPGLMSEAFVRRAGDGFAANRHVKSLVRLPRITEMVTQHYFRTRGRYLLDDGSAPPAGFEGIAPRASFTRGFAIHHYITKSRAQCERKIARGRPKPAWSDKKYRPPTYFTHFDNNPYLDRRAAEIIAPVRDAVLELRDRIGRD